METVLLVITGKLGWALGILFWGIIISIGFAIGNAIVETLRERYLIRNLRREYAQYAG